MRSNPTLNWSSTLQEFKEELGVTGEHKSPEDDAETQKMAKDAIGIVRDEKTLKDSEAGAKETGGKEGMRIKP